MLMRTAVSSLQADASAAKPVSVDYGWLFLVHKRKEHRWLWLGSEAVRLSAPFTFFHHSYIEFCCSLSVYYIGLGVNDSSAMLVSMPAHWVDELTWIEVRPEHV